MSALGIPGRGAGADPAPRTNPAGPAGDLGRPGGPPRPSRRRRGAGLRSGLVSTALLAAALPVLLTGGLAALLLAARPDIAATVPGSGPDTHAEHAARFDGFLSARIADARTWAATPAIVRAARASEPAQFAEVLAEVLGQRSDQPLPAVDGADPRAEADSFLHRQLAASPWLARVSFTDRHGFTVASTAPTGGLLRATEPWWQSAWRDGIAVGQVQYDESAGLTSLDLSVRIDDPGGDAPLGVLKTVFTVEPIGTMAGRAAPPVPSGRIASVTPDGTVAASGGFGGPRIVNVSAGVGDRAGLSMRAERGAGRDGFPLERDGPPREASHAGTFAAWLDRLGLEKDIPLEVMALLPDPDVVSARIEDALVDRRLQLALALGAIAMLSALFAALLAGSAARRYTAALRSVTEMAERAARGERAPVAEIETPREIARLGDAVHRLARLCNRAGEPLPVGSAHAR